MLVNNCNSLPLSSALENPIDQSTSGALNAMTEFDIQALVAAPAAVGPVICLTIGWPVFLLLCTTTDCGVLFYLGFSLYDEGITECEIKTSKTQYTSKDYINDCQSKLSIQSSRYLQQNMSCQYFIPDLLVTWPQKCLIYIALAQAKDESSARVESLVLFEPSQLRRSNACDFSMWYLLRSLF